MKKRKQGRPTSIQTSTSTQVSLWERKRRDEAKPRRVAIKQEENSLLTEKESAASIVSPNQPTTTAAAAVAVAEEEEATATATHQAATA